jgi:hypothetical protein
MADKDKKPPVKRLGGLNSGPAASRLGVKAIFGMSAYWSPLRCNPAADPSLHAACSLPAGGLRTGDGAGPSSTTGAGAAAAGARKVGCHCCLLPPRRPCLPAALRLACLRATHSRLLWLCTAGVGALRVVRQCPAAVVERACLAFAGACRLTHSSCRPLQMRFMPTNFARPKQRAESTSEGAPSGSVSVQKKLTQWLLQIDSGHKSLV